MFQYLWLYDFFGLLLARFLFAIALFWEGIKTRKESKFALVLNIVLSILFLLGFLSSLSAITLILMEIVFIIKKRKTTEKNLFKIVFAILMLFIGPGLVSIDRIINLRW